MAEFWNKLIWQFPKVAHTAEHELGFPRASLLRTKAPTIESVALCFSLQVCIGLWGCLITQALAQSDLSPWDPSNQRADEALVGGPKQCQLMVLQEYWFCFSDHCSLTTKKFSSSFYCGVSKTVLDPSARKSCNSAAKGYGAWEAGGMPQHTPSALNQLPLEGCCWQLGIWFRSQFAVKNHCFCVQRTMTGFF